MKKNNIAVFCGSANGNDPMYKETAEKLGTLIGTQGRGLVYGSGAFGLMGVVSHAAIVHGAHTIGVNLARFETPERGHEEHELFVTEQIQDRKLLIINKSDACIALPGGIGTLDEMGDALAMRQLGLTNKPLGILNVNGFYDHLLALFDHMHECGFLKDKYMKNIIADSDPERLLAMLDDIE